MGTLFFMLEQLGCNCWRDMNQEDLTERGMEQGVVDSDVFVLFLTNKVLSRPYCLKEIGWALDHNKPIVLLVEEDTRFAPFDYTRWTENRCEFDKTAGVWVAASDLASDYAACPPHIKSLIEGKHVGAIPYRRRDFEAAAMVRELLHRTSAAPHALPWGKHLPPSLALGRARLGEPRSIAVVRNGSNAAAAEMAAALERTATAGGSAVMVAPGPETADHVVVVLSSGVLAEGSESLATIQRIVAARPGTQYSFVYSLEAGWEFGGDEFRAAPPAVQDAINSHEAMVFRPASGATLYEHTAMVLEMLRSVRRVAPSAAASSALPTPL